MADAVSDSFKNISFKKPKSFATELGGMVAIKIIQSKRICNSQAWCYIASVITRIKTKH